MLTGKRRYGMLFWLFFITLISMMDRVNIAIAAPFMMKEMALSPSAMGIIMSAFTIGFAFSNFSAGFLLEKLSCRRLLSGIILFWSVMTVFTGLAWSFLSLLIIRIAFGLFEGPMPAANTAIVNNWMFPGERGRASGLWLTAIPIGTILGNMLSAVIATEFGWRAIFYVFGIGGIFVAVLNWILMRDNPADHPGMTAGEVSEIQAAIGQRSRTMNNLKSGMTFKQLMANGAVWTLFGIFFALLCLIWANVNWLPTYFMKTRGANLIASGFFTSITAVCGTMGPLAVGWLSDKGGNRIRSLWLALALFLVVPSIVVAINASSIAVCLAGFSVATFLCYGCLGIMFTMPMELFEGTDVAKVAGIMLSGGSLGGIVGAILVGYVLQVTASFNMAYYVFSGFAFAAACLSLLLLRKERLPSLSVALV